MIKKNDIDYFWYHMLLIKKLLSIGTNLYILVSRLPISLLTIGIKIFD